MTAPTPGCRRRVGASRPVWSIGPTNTVDFPNELYAPVIHFAATSRRWTKPSVPTKNQKEKMSLIAPNQPHKGVLIDLPWLFSEQPWWTFGAALQIRPDAFYDARGTGMGDFQGIKEK